MILEYITGLINCFNIVDTLWISNINGSDIRKWIAKIEINNIQILVLKTICLHYPLYSQLGIQQTRRLLRLFVKKNKVF